MALLAALTVLLWLALVVWFPAPLPAADTHGVPNPPRRPAPHVTRVAPPPGCHAAGIVGAYSAGAVSMVVGAIAASWWHRPGSRRSGAAPGRGTSPGAWRACEKQTILVYRGDRLAATFVLGAPPMYHGEAGERVRALVEAERPRYNPWTLEVRDSGLYHDTPQWFLASVLLGSGGSRASFRVLSFGEPGARPRWPLA